MQQTDPNTPCFVCAMPAIRGIVFGMEHLHLCPYHAENPPEAAQIEAIRNLKQAKKKKGLVVDYSGSHQR